MNRARETARPAITTWGWAIALTVAGLVALQGMVHAVFIAAPTQKDNALLMDIPTAAIGLQSMIVAAAGLRSGGRWPWNALWVFFVMLAARGVHSSFLVAAGERPLVIAALWLSAAAAVLVGQLLSARGLQR